MQKIRTGILKIEGVSNIHHLHVWAISTSQNAMTAHLVVSNTLSKEQEQLIKNNIRHEMEHMNIQHVTIETEYTDEACRNENC
jgi:cobalt-zinc-cadmium efflux system protein